MTRATLATGKIALKRVPRKNVSKQRHRGALGNPGLYAPGLLLSIPDRLSPLWITWNGRIRLAVLAGHAHLTCTNPRYTVTDNPAALSSSWKQCVRALETALSDQQLNTWIRPLQTVEDGETVKLLAPNRFVVDWVQAHCLEQIRSWWQEHAGPGTVLLEVGSRRTAPIAAAPTAASEPK